MTRQPVCYPIEGRPGYYHTIRYYIDLEGEEPSAVTLQVGNVYTINGTKYLLIELSDQEDHYAAVYCITDHEYAPLRRMSAFWFAYMSRATR